MPSNEKPDHITDAARKLLRGGCSVRSAQAAIEKQHGEHVSLGWLQKQRNRVVAEVWLQQRPQIQGDWRSACDHAEKHKEQYKQYDYSVRHAEINMADEYDYDPNKPLILVFMADVHFGSLHVDYARFKQDLELILKTPNCFLVLGGDDVDNYQKNFRNAKAVHSAIFNPQLQRQIWMDILREAGGKIVAKIRGNHNEFSDMASGDDADWYVHKDANYAYIPDGGLIELTVGDQVYKILIHHKPQGNSQKNKTNANKNMLQKKYPMADITVSEDKHDPVMETEFLYDHDAAKQVVHVRCGTYKTDGDDYAYRGWKEGVHGTPTIVLYPGKKKMVPFLSNEAIEDAIAYVGK